MRRRTNAWGPYLAVLTVATASGRAMSSQMRENTPSAGMSSVTLRPYRSRSFAVST